MSCWNCASEGHPSIGSTCLCARCSGVNCACDPGPMWPAEDAAEDAAAGAGAAIRVRNEESCVRRAESNRVGGRIKSGVSRVEWNGRSNEECCGSRVEAIARDQERRAAEWRSDGECVRIRSRVMKCEGCARSESIAAVPPYRSSLSRDAITLLFALLLRAPRPLRSALPDFALSSWVQQSADDEKGPSDATPLPSWHSSSAPHSRARPDKRVAAVSTSPAVRPRRTSHHQQRTAIAKDDRQRLRCRWAKCTQ